MEKFMFWQSLFLNTAGFVMIVLGLYTLYEGLIARKPFVIIDNITKDQVNSMKFVDPKSTFYHCLIAVANFLSAYLIFELV